MAHATYESVASTLRAEATARDVTALPDGSVDTYYEVLDSRGDPVASRATFGERIAEGRQAFAIERGATEPGGQAVNAALQLGALGDAVRLFGHLDHPVFEDLPVDRVSMGPPASVSVYDFDDGDLVLADSPP